MAPTASSVDDMTWWAYVRKHVGDVQRRAAEAAGVTPSAVSRWNSGGTPDPVAVATFARTCGRPVLEAFVAAGFLTAEEAGERPSAPPSLQALDDEELLDEVRERMRRGGTNGTTPEAEEKMSGPTGARATGKALPPDLRRPPREPSPRPSRDPRVDEQG